MRIALTIGIALVSVNALAQVPAPAQAAAGKTPPQKIADVMAKIVALSSVHLPKVAQDTFGAGCFLSVVRNARNFSITVDLGRSNENELKVVKKPDLGVWSIDGLRTSTGTTVLVVADQARMSQMFALLPEAIRLCRGTAPALENK